MRFDLQDVWRRNPKAFIAGAVVILAAFGALIVKGAVGSSSHKHHTSTVVARTSTSAVHSNTKPTTHNNGVTTPNPSYHPAYTPVPASPADQKLAASEEASGSDIAKIEGISAPPPAWTKDYPSVKPSVWHGEQQYITAFVTELLDRDYRTQSRSDLGRWLSAESASDVLPGVPATAGDNQLYAEMIEPQQVGLGSSPVPTASQWNAFAQAGERQHAYGIFVNPNASWAKSVSAGITTKDPLLDIQNVTGAIRTTVHGKTTTQHFSMELFVGSALHHPGYGAWGFDEWNLG